MNFAAPGPRLRATLLDEIAKAFEITLDLFGKHANGISSFLDECFRLVK